MKITPLPRLPVICLALSQLAECVALSSILPWLQEALWLFGIVKLTDESNRGRAMGVIPAARGSGLVLGALLGGTLSSRKIGGDSSFLKRYPYLIASVAAACVPALAAVTIACFLPEVRV
jgi:hypothetical protein